MGKRLVPGVCLVDTLGIGAGTPVWNTARSGRIGRRCRRTCQDEVTAACFNNSRLCSTQPPVLPSTALQQAVVTSTAHDRINSAPIGREKAGVWLFDFRMRRDSFPTKLGKVAVRSTDGWGVGR